MTPSPNAPTGQKSWLRRNLLWLVPVGCLVPMLCCGVFGAATFVGVNKAIQSSSIYAETLASAVANEDVKKALGTPITPGFVLQGSIEETNGVGEADFEIPLKGPRGEATVWVVASKKAGGRWAYTHFEVDLGMKRLDLLEVARMTAPDRTDGKEAPNREQ